MKKILIFAIIALPMLEIRGQVTSDCPELLYTPYYVNPNPNSTVLPPSDPPLLTPPPPPEGAEVRGIFWVHGLGGNPHRWDRANQATLIGVGDGSIFPARNVITGQLTYGTNSLVTAGLNLEEAIWDKKTPFENAGVIDHLRNYVIGHSQGGLVARMTDKEYDILTDRRMFGGIVTFGTSNGGAYILNSRDNHHLEYFAQEGCQAIGSAELLSALGQNTSPFIFNIVYNEVPSLINGACDLISGLLPLTLFADLNTPISDDYLVGASELADLNSHGNPNVVKVAMHGSEYADGEDPSDPKQLMFRLFSSRGATSAPVFGADDDNELVDKANQQTARYLQEYHRNMALGIHYGQGQGPIWNYLKAKKHFRLAATFIKAYDFMQKADDKWKEIIGAHAWVPNAPDACMCEWINNIDGWSLYGAAPGVNSSGECADFVANYNVPGEYVYCNWSPASLEWVTKSSDGVVLEESAMAFPGAITYPMFKTNHLQMRNCSETQRALLDLYTGAIDPFFITEKK